jgi:hypothetical protein
LRECEKKREPSASRKKLTDGSGIELMELVGGKFDPDVFSPAVATRKTMGGVLK